VLSVRKNQVRLEAQGIIPGAALMMEDIPVIFDDYDKMSARPEIIAQGVESHCVLHICANNPGINIYEWWNEDDDLIVEDHYDDSQL